MSEGWSDSTVSNMYEWLVIGVTGIIYHKDLGVYSCRTRLVSREPVNLAYDDSAMLSMLWVSFRLLITGTLGVYWCRTHYPTQLISRESVWIQTDSVAYWEIVMPSNSGSVVLWWIRLLLWMRGYVLPIEGLFPMDHFRPLRNCVNEWDQTEDISVQEMVVIGGKSCSLGTNIFSYLR